MAPPHCMASIGFRQAISPQLHSGLGLRKWLTRALGPEVYILCVLMMGLHVALLLFNALISCNMLLKRSLSSRAKVECLFVFAVLTNFLVWFVCTVVHISCFFKE